MRKPKAQVDEEGGTEAPFFDEFDSEENFADQDDDSTHRDPRQRKKPARQRVELRNEQQSLRRQLSDWDDYGQEDFETKL